MMIISNTKLRNSLRYIVTISGIVIFLAIFQRNGTKINIANILSNPNHNINNTATSESFSGVYINYIITKYNVEMKILNSDIYANVKENSVIFVILMDKLSNKLKYLLASLSEVRGISVALLIFSHSYYDEDVSKMVSDIDFCRVLQIFYPYSLQTHPLVFPGQDPNDCPTNMNKNKAIMSKCTGASFPDFRGHYRNPVLAERKHHWWWTCNMIFEKMKLVKRDQKESGLVIFLDHDYYLIKDFMYMALYMKNIAALQPRCEFLSMGTELAPFHYRSHTESYIDIVELTTFNPKLHSSVIAFGLKTWNSIISHYDLFCSVDDSSWLRSLYYISVKWKERKQFLVMSSSTPRAYKISAYKNTVGRIEELQKLYEMHWFPSHIELYIKVELDCDSDLVFDYADSEGGWADPRDRSLCVTMTITKMKKVLMEMANDE